MTFAVSQSKIKSWLSCRQQYHYKYVDFLKKKRIKRPFQFGRIIHSMCEAELEGDDPFDILKKIDLHNANMFKAEKEEYGAIIEDIEVIMREYFTYWKRQPLKPVRVNKRSTEHLFEVPITKTIVAKGRIDAVVRAKDLRWLVEHKSFGRMPTEDTRWRSIQSASYHRIIQIMGWKPVDGTLWDYIWSKPPSRPEILQSGKMSQKSNTVSLPGMVRLVLKKNNLKEADYAEYIKLMEFNRPRYFDRIFSPRKKVVEDQLFADYVEVAQEMEKLAGTSKRRTIGFHCTNCDYEPLCRAALQGSDVEFVKEREYIVDENDYQEELIPEEL